LSRLERMVVVHEVAGSNPASHPIDFPAFFGLRCCGVLQFPTDFRPPLCRRNPSSTAAAGAANLRHLVPFWLLSASGWAALTVLWAMQHGREGRGGKGRPRSERFVPIAILIVAVGLAARIAVLLTHDPCLSDDVYRYVFDGRNTAAGVNPYLIAPAQRLAPAARPAEKDSPESGDVRSGPEPPADEPAGLIPVPQELRDYAERWAGESVIVRLINNRELHTIYLPTSQWVFALAGALVPDAWRDPDAAARVFRAVFVGIELLAMILILAALGMMKQSPWWLALYAWHPLPLTEIAGSGHQDIIGIVLLIAALLLYTATPMKIGRWLWSLALATLVKPVTVPAAAILLRGRSWKSWLLAAAAGAAICLAVAAPLWLTDGARPLANLLDTAGAFTFTWAHFGSVYEPLLTAIESLTPDWSNVPRERLARLICISLLGIIIFGIWLRGRDAWADCALIFLAMVLLSTTAHPWYLLWALALIAVARSPAVWVASLTLPWGYLAWADPGEWSVPWWALPAAYGPVYAVLAAQLVQAWRRPAAERSA
ncbi:MAG: hypothetical protein SYC29_02580, partial [Planctomycetota bacterium]|nr:hypothetical protein [Planctomycetota bacterium]